MVTANTPANRGQEVAATQGMTCLGVSELSVTATSQTLAALIAAAEGTDALSGGLKQLTFWGDSSVTVYIAKGEAATVNHPKLPTSLSFACNAVDAADIQLISAAGTQRISLMQEG